MSNDRSPGRDHVTDDEQGKRERASSETNDSANQNDNPPPPVDPGEVNTPGRNE